MAKTTSLAIVPKQILESFSRQGAKDNIIFS